METKSALPHDLIKDKGLSSTVEAYFEFNHLKQLYRQGWLQNGVPAQKCESVAEHSFSAALLALFLVDTHVPKLDKWKVLCMTLLHDLGEVHAGDFTPRDTVEPQEKSRLEQQSVKKILSKLPEGSAYISLWEEYEAGESPEAKFVREIDRLEMGLQASVYQQQGLVEPAPFFSSAKKALVSPSFLDILSELEKLMSLPSNNVEGLSSSALLS